MNNTKVVELYKPFSCFEHLLKSLFVFNNFSHYNINTLTKIINKTTDGFASNLEISNLKSKVELSPEFYGTVFFLEKNFKAKIESFIDIDLNCIQFSSYSKNCIFCSSKLSGDKSRFSKAICYYFADGPKSVQLNIVACGICGALHYLNYAEKDKQRKFYSDFLDAKFVAFTDETIFETKLLNSFTADLICNHTSFMGFASSYNILHDCKQKFINENRDKNERACLNEVRLCDAWFYFKYLSISLEINKILPFPAPPMANLNSAIRTELKPCLSAYFVKKWTGNIIQVSIF